MSNFKKKKKKLISLLFVVYQFCGFRG